METVFDFYRVPSPSYVIDEAQLENNLQILRDISVRAGCKILLAQKAFSLFRLYPLIGRYLDGTAASGLHEAMLGRDYMGKENHVFSAAYTETEMDSLLNICDHIVFNSFSQWKRYRKKAVRAKKRCGLRVNPECSTQKGALYDPCAPYSRLGVTIGNFEAQELDNISGLHFHTLCEQNADALQETLTAFTDTFSPYLNQMEWVNMGGGHHITRPDYNRDALVETILGFKEKHPLQVYLEPGEAVALNAGYLVCTVLDIVRNQKNIAILDTSAACHMPDVLEMPYRPAILGAGKAGEKPHSYILAGPTCLAGDIIGEYSFDKPLAAGDRLVFTDMAIYTMVKNNTFNGMNLPSIVIYNKRRELETVRTFGYADFKGRLS